MEDRKEAILKRLKQTVQLLASSAEMQLQMLPSYVFKADELAQEFDRWRELTLGNYKGDLNATQLSALTALHKNLEELTAGGEEDWTDEAIRTSREWENVRGLAASVLNAFGWPAETPPSYAHEYIPPDRTPMVLLNAFGWPAEIPPSHANEYISTDRAQARKKEVKRPFGVTLLALFEFSKAGFLPVLMAIGLKWPGALSGAGPPLRPLIFLAYHILAARTWPWPQLKTHRSVFDLGKPETVIPLFPLFAIISVVFGLGLWRMRRWAPSVLIAVYGYYLLCYLVEVLPSLAFGQAKMRVIVDSSFTSALQ